MIDPEENFYDSLDDLMLAISENKFPTPPARNLYFVCGGQPKRRVVKEFIHWILTEGQPYVKSAGYVHLAKETIDSATVKLQ